MMPILIVGVFERAISEYLQLSRCSAANSNFAEGRLGPKAINNVPILCSFLWRQGV